MQRKGSYFRLINPLQPPDHNGPFGELAELVAEAATWLFYDPKFGAADDDKLLTAEPSLTTVNLAIAAAFELLDEATPPRSTKRAVTTPTGPNDGVDLGRVVLN